MLMRGSAALEFIFLEFYSLVMRAKTLQFCCPEVMSASFVIELMSEDRLKEGRR